MDISDITNVQQLKAMAYDQMIMLEQVQRNLTLITNRIAEIESASIKQADKTITGPASK